MKLKVVAVSSNANSFGLRQMIFISDDGHAFSACASTLNLKEQGSILNFEGVPTEAEVVDLFVTKYNFELPELLPDPPASSVSDAFPDITVPAVAFFAAVRIRDDHMPWSATLADRSLKTTDFRVSDHESSIAPRLAAETACVKHCEMLLASGLFDYYQVCYRTKDGRTWHHDKRRESKMQPVVLS
jgi:hypothetical protein